MTNDPNDVGDDPDNGGDIASGFGDSVVTGPVSDEKVELMRQWAATHSGPPASDPGDGQSGATD
ncbi:MAG TPA: hypothetical protein PKE46_14940 [Micropruina sp.]|nr:hypothetical protein [Propionibacterium sp.]HMQ39018.1 hypothetical protein [Micropruina sp.]HMR23429.1 hypothetical protein [Micropruina sp.]